MFSLAILMMISISASLLKLINFSWMAFGISFSRDLEIVAILYQQLMPWKDVVNFLQQQKIYYSTSDEGQLQLVENA
ncbi:hypothetical protein [Legionella sp.]|uniref:hypothetical protein n=1 Tax=Legionella sp. TaxID=459 RepID=UPI003D0E4CF2